MWKPWFLLSKNVWWIQKILKYDSGEKSIKVPYIIYTDLECLLEKIDACQNNKEKSYTEKKAKHEPSGYSLVTCCSYDKLKNERKYYRAKDCMEMFCKDLRKQAMKIINYEKKEMIPLTIEEKESYRNQEVCYICEKEFSTNKKDQKVKDHCHYTWKYSRAAHNSCNLRYEIPKEIHVAFGNGSTHDYHFITEQPAKDLKVILNALEKILKNILLFLYQLK